jgi:hypothetical protein
MMMRRCRSLLLPLFVAACNDAEPVVEAVTVTDSAGVRIIASSAPAWGSTRGWQVDTTPELVIGDAATLPSVLLVSVTAVRQLDDGRLVTTLDDDKSVRWFDGDGREIRRVGRPGEGPGEFRSVTLVGLIGDSLLMWDGQLDRATVLAPDGATVRTFTPAFADTGVAYGMAVSGAFSDGRLLLAGRSGAQSAMPSGLRRDTIPLAVANRDGRLEQVIARVLSHENVIVTGPGFVTMLPRPFGARTAITPDGTTLLVSDGQFDQVIRYSLDGGPTTIYRLDRPRRQIALSEVEQQRRRLAQQVEQLPETIGQAVSDAMAGVGVPTVYPAHDRILVDANGAIWMREDIGPRRTEVEGHHWDVLDREGRWLGQVTTPARLEVYQVTRDRVVGVWRDENDVEHLRVHRLSR